MTSGRPASRWKHSGDTPTGAPDLTFSWAHFYISISLAFCKLHVAYSPPNGFLDHERTAGLAGHTFEKSADHVDFACAHSTYK